MISSSVLINKISFSSNKNANNAAYCNAKSDDSDRRKEAAKDAVKGGGAVAATSAALSNGQKVDMFRKAGKASKELEKGSIAL